MPAQSKTYWLCFLADFQLTRMTFWCDVEADQVELSESVFKVTFIALRETTVVVQTALKTFYVGMQSDVYEPTLFKICIMADVTELYILMLGKANLTLIQICMGERKHELLRRLSYLAKFSIDLDGI